MICNGVGKTKFEATGSVAGNGLATALAAQLAVFWQYGSLNGPGGGVSGPTCGLNGVKSTTRLFARPVMRVSLNRPTPPRKLVFALPNTSYANPTRGEKFSMFEGTPRCGTPGSPM